MQRSCWIPLLILVHQCRQLHVTVGESISNNPPTLKNNENKRPIRRIGDPNKRKTINNDRILSNIFLNSSASFVMDEMNNTMNTLNEIFTHDSNIVGGTKVSSATTYPYLVSILEVDMWTNTAIHQCAGTLILPDVVLTAGHCVEYSAMRIINVGRFNWYDNDTTEQVEPYRIDKVYIHPEFNGNFFVNDIALVKLNRAVTNVDTFATLPRQNEIFVNVGDSISIIGWGLTKDKGMPSPDLLEVDLDVISKSECQRTYGKFISDAMFCAYGEGKDACQV